MNATTPHFLAGGARASIKERGPVVSWAFLGLLLVADQLLLPMFHAGGAPFKFSYTICVLWLLQQVALGRRNQAADAEFRSFAFAIGVIVACGMLGEIWLAAHHPIVDYAQTLRSVLIYVLVVLSFGLGQSAHKFRFTWLVPILLAALMLNFGFIFLRSAMPSYIVDLYYSELNVSSLQQFGVNDVRGLLEMARPRGLFGNPNVSGLLVNIIVLFIHLGLRHRLLATPKPLIGLAIVLLPIPLEIVLASRGEFVVACVLGALNYAIIFRRSGRSRRLRLILYSSIVPFVAVLALVRVLGADTMAENFDRALSVVDVVSKVSEGTQEEKALGSVARPLMMLQTLAGRFVFSPVFGSGFSSTAGPPFAEQTDYFHNDWFRVIATSGLIGLAAMLWILWKYCLPLGWVALVPFVLPGMVNTFMLVIPAFMFYFFMIGVIRERLRLSAGGSA